MAGGGRAEMERQLSLTCEFLKAHALEGRTRDAHIHQREPPRASPAGILAGTLDRRDKLLEEASFPRRPRTRRRCLPKGSARAQERGFRVPHDRRPRPGPLVSCGRRAHRTPRPKAGTGRRDNDITSLKRAEERVRALSSRLMRLQDDERGHIIRALHDSLGQYLTSMKINFDILKREAGSLGEQHRALLVESAETLEKCVQEVRSVSYLLHPPLLDELGLLAALRWFTAGFSERSGIAVNLDTPNEFSRLPAEMELALFSRRAGISRQYPAPFRQRYRFGSLSRSIRRARKSASSITAWASPRKSSTASSRARRSKASVFAECTNTCANWAASSKFNPALWVRPSPPLLPLKLAGPKREGDERKSRLAGKRMARREISDVRIESVAAEKAGVRANPATGRPET